MQPHAPASTDEAWLRFVLAPRLGAQAVLAMLARHGSADAAACAPLAEWRSVGACPAAVEALAQPDRSRLRHALDWLAVDGRSLVTLDSPDYPPLLREIPGRPLVLFIDGDPGTLVLPQLAIVGSRSATPGGLQNAEAFARCLAGAGFCITSGLAEGIDGAAHRGALRAGGRTIAVCGTGLDRTYPRRHAALAREITASGALVSEFAPGAGPAPGNFPRRNRIISGLSVGTLVVEAAVRSGALITANFACEQGREVFAVPGSIHSPQSRGCHRLIRNGARLVETATDIVEELGGLLQQLGLLAANGGERSPDVASAVAEGPRRLLEALGWDPVDMDTLVIRSGLTPAELSSMLLPLELEGLVRSLSGGRLQRTMRNGSS
jgi:DNA processing protein